MHYLSIKFIVKNFKLSTAMARTTRRTTTATTKTAGKTLPTKQQQ
jgi:hypothetical protein